MILNTFSVLQSPDIKVEELIFLGIALNWYIWLFIILIACCAIDWLTGSLAALKNGEWSSREARSGGIHKLGSIAAVVAALLLDCVVFIVTSYLPVQFPFDYFSLFAPLVTVWYIVTELGSIVENAAKLGAPVPNFLVKALKQVKDKADKNNDSGGEQENKN